MQVQVLRFCGFEEEGEGWMDMGDVRCAMVEVLVNMVLILWLMYGKVWFCPFQVNLQLTNGH